MLTVLLYLNVTTRSWFPSVLKSPIAVEVGKVPVVTSTTLEKPPVPSPTRMLTLSPSEFATARSMAASSLKSPRAMDAGLRPTGKLIGPGPNSSAAREKGDDGQQAKDDRSRNVPSLARRRAMSRA